MKTDGETPRLQIASLRLAQSRVLSEVHNSHIFDLRKLPFDLRLSLLTTARRNGPQSTERYAKSIGTDAQSTTRGPSVIVGRRAFIRAAQAVLLQSCPFRSPLVLSLLTSTRRKAQREGKQCRKGCPARSKTPLMTTRRARTPSLAAFTSRAVGSNINEM
jgi:hypothetical protein